MDKVKEKVVMIETKGSEKYAKERLYHTKTRSGVFGGGLFIRQPRAKKEAEEKEKGTKTRPRC